MKKTIFLITTFFIIYGASAQETETVIPFKTKFGIKGGLTFLTNSNLEFNESAYVGLFSETRISKKWSLQNEVLISPSEGFLEIPILIKYHINDKFEILLGPKLDLIVDGVNDFPRRNGNINLSLAAGVQYNISKRFFIEGRYSKGLTDPRFGFDRDTAIDTFKFGIGFKFN